MCFFISLLECRPPSIITVYYIKLKTFEFYVEYMLAVLAIFFTFEVTARLSRVFKIN